MNEVKAQYGFTPIKPGDGYELVPANETTDATCQFLNSNGSWDGLGCLAGSTAARVCASLCEVFAVRRPIRTSVVICGKICTFQPDGSVKLSCGDVISNEKIEEFLKRRQEARKDEWPKYWWNSDTEEIYRAMGEADLGQYFCKVLRDWRWCFSPLAKFVIGKAQFYPRTRSEASAIVGAKNL